MSSTSIRGWATALALALAPLPAAAQGGARMPAPIVFLDIVGPELPKQAQFYREVFGWQTDSAGNAQANYCQPNLSNGTASCTFNAPGNGSYRLRLVYSGDSFTFNGLQDYAYSSQQVAPEQQPAHFARILSKRLYPCHVRAMRAAPGRISLERARSAVTC